MAKTDVLSKILFEAKSYEKIEDIEKLVEIGSDLSMVPMQPLYVAVSSTSSDQIATLLPRFSEEQRQTLIDLDLWNKDRVEPESFENWIEVYSKVKEIELTQEFVTSEDFYLYLKSRVNIYTFDSEDPMYPDHDYYFLTDDTQLLVEYSKEYRYPNELKYLIRMMYDKLGVENAYTTLFKLINDSYAELEESRYQDKKERLREFGFVDYFEALEKLNPFISYGQVDSFLTKKNKITPNIDIMSQNQSLHGSALVSFDSEMENILNELAKVKDEKRLNYLHFTFIRLINSTITLKNALRSGRVELTRIGKYSKNCLELGLQYVRESKQYGEQESVFSFFDFFDLYKVGHSLLSIEKGRVKKAISKTPFDGDDYEYFLGAWWGAFLDNVECEIPKVKSFGAGLHAREVSSLVVFNNWVKEVSLFCDSLPFINSFFTSFTELKSAGKLLDDFYLNYSVDNIDYEAIMISSFVNFSLGNFSGDDVNKMGVTIYELKEFFKQYFRKNEDDGEYILLPLTSETVKKTVQDFINKFGFDNITNFENYLYGILTEHLSGYEFDTLADEDFKHIGGPIILNSLPSN